MNYREMLIKDLDLRIAILESKIRRRQHVDNMGAFSVIEVGGDWTLVDQIDGKDMEPGMYEVKWPDGTVDTHPIEIEQSTVDIGDMGHRYPATVRKALVVLDYHGVKVKVPAAGLGLRKLAAKASAERKPCADSVE